jgi:hypothetical protein
MATVPSIQSERQVVAESVRRSESTRGPSAPKLTASSGTAWGANTVVWRVK